MLAEATAAVAEHHPLFSLNGETLIWITNFGVIIVSAVLAALGIRDGRRHREEAAREHNRHEEHIVDGIATHDEQELADMVRIIEKVLEDRQTQAAAPEATPETPNLRSA